MKQPATRRIEEPLIRVLSMLGVVGIGVALGAILTSQHEAGWLTGLIVSLVSIGLTSLVRAMSGGRLLR
ncbi:MAG: hypothetical protein NVSMB51_07520 [Solirubrobacteraceae bacterium]